MTWNARVTSPDGTNPSQINSEVEDYHACQTCRHGQFTHKTLETSWSKIQSFITMEANGVGTVRTKLKDGEFGTAQTLTAIRTYLCLLPREGACDVVLTEAENATELFIELEKSANPYEYLIKPIESHMGICVSQRSADGDDAKEFFWEVSITDESKFLQDTRVDYGVLGGGWKRLTRGAHDDIILEHLAQQDIWDWKGIQHRVWRTESVFSGHDPVDTGQEKVAP